MENSDEIDQTMDASSLMGADADDTAELAPKPAKKAKPAKAKAETAPTTAAQGMPKRIKILLEENDDIPPTGLPLGHNGNTYVILPGEPVEVPEFLLEILDHAVMSAPQVDPQTRRVVGYRDRLRFPYRRLG